MKHLLLEPEFDAWRVAAREALQAGFRPEELDLQDATFPAPLSLTLEADDAPHGTKIATPHVPRAFLEAAQVAAAHRDQQRWNLLYRILFRLQSERHLLRLETDDDVAGMLRLASQVRRDLHKMHAFVRFRKVLEPDNPSPRPVVLDEAVHVHHESYPNVEAHHLVLETPTPFGPLRTAVETCPPKVPIADKDYEHYIAWYQPDHRILPLAAPFFAERFAVMRWSILTPDASVSWDPLAKKLTFAAGMPRESAPAADELENLWRRYYSSIYNPARLNPEAMRAEMPVRYWKNLPEVEMLPMLITQSRTRVETMINKQQSQPTAQPFVPEDRSLRSLQEALPKCKGCELYCAATRVVPGRGPVGASLMLVGEQPGDQEDLRGESFVGPAGAVLDRVLEELRIPRSEIYVTNAVKHFKFTQRGKLRLHMSPRMGEIVACRPWLLAEIEAVQPKVVLCLGASASKSLLGGTFALMKDHGKQMHTPFADKVFATIHPSAVLRGRDEANRQQLKGFLTDDLAKAWHSAQDVSLV